MTEHSAACAPATQASWLAAMQLASPALPIGGFSYSQGLEAAVAAQWVHDTASASQWCLDAARVFAHGEGTVFALQFAHVCAADGTALNHVNQWFYASRETQELRLETQQMGWSMVKLAQQNGWLAPPTDAIMLSMQGGCLPTAFAAAAYGLGLSLEQALTAFAFSWAENQVAAAVKAVPLGQQAGQTVLGAVRQALPALLDVCKQQAALGLAGVNTFSPHLAILSSRHETQYTRLFRS